MKKINKAKIWLTSFLILMIGAFSVSASVAWFGKTDVINTNLLNGIEGNVLTSYFHCGTGKADDPFIITRPKHFENLSLLHNNVENFWRALGSGSIAESKGFYFEVGCSEDRLRNPALSYASDEGKDKYVFDYDDYGFTDGTSSTKLNCISLKKDLLVPIGSTDKPFIGTIEGNNITIEDFTINGNGEADIGIFGGSGFYKFLDDIEEIKTICECGHKATCNCRFLNDKFVSDGPDILIDDGKSKIEYRALCPACVLKYQKGLK